MAPTIRLHEDFLADLKQQLLWLEQNRDETWIVPLRDALEEATRVIGRFPAVGLPTDMSDSSPVTGTVRKLVLRRVPFVIWYAVAPESAWLLRLFHVRQKAPHPKTKPRRRRLKAKSD